MVPTAYVATTFIALVAASASDIQVTTVDEKTITVMPGAALIQTKLRRQGEDDGIMQGGDDMSHAVTQALSESVDGIDHAHIVCYSLGCEEVKGKLTAIKTRYSAAKEALADCAKKRKALAKELAKLGKKRAEAEAKVAKCAEERKQLQEDLAKCGKDRAKAEADLGKCAEERAALEAELKQCAEVDRPAAEKALEKCSKERAALEKELAELLEKIKKKKSSRRRRAASLMQFDGEEKDEGASASSTETASGEADESTDVDDAETQDLLDAEERFRAEIAEKIQEADDVTAKLDAIDAQANEVLAKINKVDDEWDAIVSEMDKVEVQAQNLKTLEKLSTLQKQLEADVAAAAEAGADVEAAMKKMHEVQQALADAQQNVASEFASQTETVVEFLQLNIEAQEQHHKELLQIQESHLQKKTRLQQKLAEHEANGEAKECEKARGELVGLEAKTEATNVALKECLDTKQVLSDKIATAQAKIVESERALATCLKQKEQLKTALDDCLTRKAATLKKLKECLERKKQLKVKIEECHKKRDEARAKLAECLKKKEELKEKIKEAKKKLKGKMLLQTEHRAELTAAGKLLGDALTAMKESNQAFSDFVKGEAEVDEETKSTVKELMDQTENELEILQESEAEEGENDENTKLANKALAKMEEAAAKFESSIGEAEYEEGAAKAEAESSEKIAEGGL
eukprot:gnl/TRDRNA2_/TRDRNA2_174201_c0_seq1.p1 gnl/TRDRNA2_/TRDRNA2_174201_c0~~gnl/TRDRNA2_/TRDRNA2_174201_c0_seq1.p1  ORF type:complete len:730 (+),score=300.05 gnl/TRDRNA2_/TRDRNA2_174201_c0_seq1:118-2190(+)